MARYLVTGGAGFIGSHLVAELVRRGESVRVADNFSTGHRENLPPDIDLIEGDLADGSVARRAVSGCDYVLHQAAIPSVPRSVLNPIASNRANVDATLQVLIASRDARVRRLVFAGSSSVYGNAATLPKREDAAPNPLSPYALQKLVGERYCQLFTSLYGLETVTLRYFNVFGPRQNPESAYSGVISLFAEAIMSGRRPIVYGDGRQTRDFTYVSNVVTAVLGACGAPGVSGDVINVACGGRVSLLDVLSALQTVMGVRVDPVFGPPREGDVRDSQADITKAQRLLDFKPDVGFEEGLRKTVAWFRVWRTHAASNALGG
jgi:nucleoside-diphosphate-sugar epimerase